LLLQEWHPTKNLPYIAAEVSAGSHKEIWWLGDCQHEWLQSPKNRTAKGRITQCIYCSRKKVLAGFNDLATTHPELAAEWDYEKNDILFPTQVLSGTRKIAYWKAACGHSWQARISSRAGGNKCPYCSHKKVLEGFETLDLTHPNLALDWHPTKNGDLTARLILKGSDKVIWWLGKDCGHEWQSPVSERVRGAGCRYCVGRHLLVNFSDLATTHPDIAAQWHPTKNGELKPTEVTKGMRKTAWWLGTQCNHEWEAWIYSRTTPTALSGCPVCVNQKIVSGINDLFTSNSSLASEWHPTKNDPLLNTEISPNSNKKIWWLGLCNHEWQASVASRSAGNGCNICWKRNITSKPEKAIFDFLSELEFRIERSNRTALGNKQEIDLYLPDRNFGIEFNGLYWHSEEQGKGRNYHQDKYLAAKAAGVQLLQIWEDDWRDRKPVILRALAHKLGVTDKLAELYPELETTTSKVFARKTQVVMLGTSQAKAFLEFNHIQGFVSGSYYLGLQDADNVLRAVLVLKKEPGTNDKTLNIVRYATAGSVTGGFTKLLKYAIRAYEPDDFITFADHAISDGGLYESNGFVVDKILPPDYMYVVKGERKHKFGYRLKRFKNDPELLWDEGLSERQLAQLNNIPRIWDAGKTRYRFTV